MTLKEFEMYKGNPDELHIYEALIEKRNRVAKRVKRAYDELERANDALSVFDYDIVDERELEQFHRRVEERKKAFTKWYDRQKMYEHCVARVQEYQ